MLRLTSVVYRTLGIVPISYSKTSKNYTAKPSNLLYTIITIVIYAYCHYVHVRSPLGAYDSTSFRGKRAVAEFFYVIYYFIDASMILACYSSVFLCRKRFAVIFNQLIMLEDRFGTVDAGYVGRTRWKFLGVLSSLIFVQLIIIGTITFLGVRVTIADTGVFPGPETLITWHTNTFLATIVVLLFVICVAEVKKMFDTILVVLSRMRQC
jgi:7tm Chemosensory receptor